MAVRTTEDAVSTIIQYDRLVIPDVDPFILAASLIVDNVIAIAPLPSTALLELVERYLAAHLIRVTDPQVQQEKVKSLMQTYATLLGKGFAITHWGSTAMSLDYTGRLAAFNNRLIDGYGKLQFFWAGVA